MREIYVRPDDLIAFAWSAPMRDLASRVSLSDVGLKKLLRGHGIVTPPQGHWNRVQAGRTVAARPRAPDRAPGGSGRIRLDRRFSDVLPDAGPWPVDGPFASKLVPEDLAELQAAVRARTPHIGVPRLATRLHPGLRALLQREDRLREKHAKYSWMAETTRFATPFWQRQIRLYNALFLGLERHNASGVLDELDNRLSARAIVGDTSVPLVMAPTGRHRTERRGGYERPASDLPATTPMTLTIDPGRDRAPFAIYADDDEGLLERRLADIVAAVVTAGEAGFRRGLREQLEWQETLRRLDEEARQRRLAAEEAQRAAALETHAASLRAADDIRALVARVAAAGTAADPAKMAAWSAWALARADRLDPVESGALFGDFGLAGETGSEPDFT